MFALHRLSSAQQYFLPACLSLVLCSELVGAAAAPGPPRRAPAQQVAYGVKAIVFSANGQLAAVIRGNLVDGPGSFDSARIHYEGLPPSNDQVEVWETGSGKLRRTFTDFGGQLRDARLSPDGHFLATTTWEVNINEPKKRAAAKHVDGDGMLRLWEVGTGELRWSKLAFGAAISIASFSPDGNRIVVGGGEWVSPGGVKIFDARTGAALDKLGYRAPVGGVAFSPDGRRLAVRKLIYGGHRSEVKIYELAGLEERLTIAEPKDIDPVPELKVTGLFFQLFGLTHSMRLREMQNLAFSPDGRRLTLSLSGEKNRELIHQILCYDAQTGKLANAITVHREPLPAGKTERKRMPYGTVTVSPLSAAARRNREALSALVYLADNRGIVALNRGLVVALWDSETGQAQWLGKSDRPATAAAFSRDGRTVAFATDGGPVSLWSSATGERQQTFGAPAAAANTLNVERLMVSAEAVVSLAFSGDGLRLASVSDNHVLKLWDARAAALQAKLADRTSAFTCLAFSSDGRHLAVGEQGGQITLFNPATAEPLRTIAGAGPPLHSLHFSPDGKWIASASDDGTVRISDVVTGESKAMIAAHRGAAAGVMFSPDGRWLASAGEDGAVKLWDGQTGTEIRALVGHTGAARAVAFSPDGRWLAGAGADKTVRLWEAQTGQPVKTLTGHGAAVNAIAFSPDGQWLASGSEDGTVRLWSVPDWKPRRTLKGHEVAVYSVSFSPDGATLAAASGNNAIAFWNPQTGELKRVLKDALTIPRRKP